MTKIFTQIFLLVIPYTANIWCVFDMNENIVTRKFLIQNFANKINANYGIGLTIFAAIYVAYEPSLPVWLGIMLFLGFDIPLLIFFCLDSSFARTQCTNICTKGTIMHFKED